MLPNINMSPYEQETQIDDLKAELNTELKDVESQENQGMSNWGIERLIVICVTIVEN